MTSKTSLPEKITQDMKLWRAQGCWSPCPTSYIEFHKNLALEALKAFEPEYRIHSQEMRPDGWMDGMQVLTVIIEHQFTGHVSRIYWFDTNQEFFVCHNSGGSSPFRFLVH